MNITGRKKQNKMSGLTIFNVLVLVHAVQPQPQRSEPFDKRVRGQRHAAQRFEQWCGVVCRCRLGPGGAKLHAGAALVSAPFQPRASRLVLQQSRRPPAPGKCNTRQRSHTRRRAKVSGGLPRANAPRRSGRGAKCKRWRMSSRAPFRSLAPGAEGRRDRRLLQR